MKALIQRVSYAQVSVQGAVIGKIEQGLLAFVGIEKQDTEASADKLLHKLLNYRVFSDQQGKMNLSVQAIQGGLLLVSQFTLAADTGKGLRPGFSEAASPEQARLLFDYLLQTARQQYQHIQTGEFAADMQVTLVNEGPVTFLLEA